MRELKIKDFILPKKLEREDNEIKILFFLSKNKKSQPQDIYETLRMSSSSFYNKKPLLEEKGFIKKETDRRKAYLSITENGLIYLQEKLTEIGMDIKTQLEIMEKDNEILTKPYMDFLKNYKTIPDDLKAEFIKLSSKIPLNQYPVSPTKSMCMLLYLAMNHPKFYQVYSIKSSDFIQQNSKYITPIDFKFFIQEAIDDRFYSITIEDDLSLYFLVNSNYGQIIESIIKMVIENDYYLKGQDKSAKKPKDSQLDSDNFDLLKKFDTKEQIIDAIIDDFHLFPTDIRDSIYQIVNQFFDKFKIEEQDLSSFPIALGLKKFGGLISKEYSGFTLYPYIHIDYHVQDLLLSNECFYDNFSTQIQIERSKIINLIYSNKLDVEEIARRTQIKFDSRETMILQAILCLKKSNYSKALDYGQKLESAYPEKYIGILIQAYVFFYYEQKTKSLKIINTFTSINIESPVLRFFKLLILQIIGQEVPKLLDSIEKEFSESLFWYFKMYLAFWNDNTKEIDPSIEKLSNFEDNSFLLRKYRILSKIQNNLLDDALKLIKKDEFRKKHDFLGIKAHIFMKSEKEQEFLEICKKMLENFPNDIGTYLMKIDFYSNQGNLRESLLELNKAITIQPENTWLYELKSQICDQLKEYDSAEDAIDTALALAPESSSFLFSKGMGYMSRFSFYRGMKFIIENINVQSGEHVEILKAKNEYYEVAQELMKLNQEEEALEYIIRAIKSDPNNPKYKALKAKILSILKKNSEALRSINKAIKLDSKNFEYLKQEIEILYDLQEYEKTLQQISHYIKERPEDPDILNMKANILLTQNNFDEALKNIDISISISPENAYYLYCKAYILDKYEKIDDSLIVIDEAIYIEPDNIDYLDFKYSLFLKLEEYEKALIIIDKIITLEPNNSHFHYKKTEMLFDINRYADALVSIDKALTINPKDPEHAIFKIHILKKLARFEDCLTYIEELLKNTENPSDFLYEKAYILMDLRRKEEAIAAMQELIKIEPKSIWYDSFGEILLSFNEYSLAVEKLEKAISLGKDDQWFYESYFKASVCHYALGDIKKSEEYFVIGKKKAPKSEWIKKAKSLIQELKQK